MKTTVSQVFCLYQFENKFIYAQNRDKRACFQAKDFTILTFPPVQGSFLFLFSSQGNITEPFLVQYDLRSRIHMCVPILVHLLSL